MGTIYVCCPAKSYTGGPTLAHQLCNTLNRMGLDSKMWYYCGWNRKAYSDPVHENYKKLSLGYIISKPEDTEESVIIATETNIGILKGYKKAHLYIWWMSVDNYYFSMSSFMDKIRKRFFGFAPSIEYCKQYMNKPKYQLFRSSKVEHLVQSQYAREFLISEGISQCKIFSLSDYLEDEILECKEITNMVREKNVILYNPKKGYEFTKKIIEGAPQYKWTPLVNLSKKQVSDLLLHSKLYIDFGNHPGKDRFPREAVVCGCCLITGKLGAAKNKFDIEISDAYKFDNDDSKVCDIVRQIDYVMENYELCLKDFKCYREKILNEKQAFENEVEFIFSKYLR